MNFTVTAFVSADLTGDKEVQEQVLHSYQVGCKTVATHTTQGIGDLTVTLSGAINPSSSPHNFMKDWRIIQKFCSHPGSENSQSNYCSEKRRKSPSCCEIYLLFYTRQTAILNEHM